MARKRNRHSSSTNSCGFETLPSVPMHDLWVVRHGERLDKVNPRWHLTAPRGAWDDPPLTERGQKQAQEVGQRLHDKKIKYVFVSPFLRCLETATNIVNQLENRHEIQLFVEPGFCEALSCTQFPPGCLTALDHKKQFPLIDTRYDHYMKTFEPEEHHLDCEGRIRSTLSAVIDRYPGNTLIVSHGSPIAAIHTVLGKKYKYVGLCTISHYHVRDSHEDSPSPNQENRMSPLYDLHDRYKFKCTLAGDSDHLTDKTNLREQIGL